MLRTLLTLTGLPGNALAQFKYTIEIEYLKPKQTNKCIQILLIFFAGIDPARPNFCE